MLSLHHVHVYTKKISEPLLHHSPPLPATSTPAPCCPRFFQKTLVRQAPQDHPSSHFRLSHEPAPQTGGLLSSPSNAGRCRGMCCPGIFINAYLIFRLINVLCMVIEYIRRSMTSSQGFMGWHFLFDSPQSHNVY